MIGRAGGALGGRLSPRRVRLALALSFAEVAGAAGALSAEDAGAYPPTRLIADALGPNGAALCLAVDPSKPLRGLFTIPPTGPTGKPHVAAGPFYPVVVAACDKLAPDAPALWSATDDRELRVQVNGKPMCLSARPMDAFLPLVEPFLDAFAASQPGSPFAYLSDDWKPGGLIDMRRADFYPELVVGACGQSDGEDFWVYDDPSGTISGPAGPGRHRPCATIHADRRTAGGEIAPGTPVAAGACPDSRRSADLNISALDRAALRLTQRWRIEAGRESLPTYEPRDPKDYFSGQRGLPIAGPMGRCLTADSVKPSLFTADCDGRVEQDWKFLDNQIRLESRSACVAANADGSATLAPCSSARNELWAYTIRDATASGEWLRAEAFGLLRMVDDPAKCLVVVNDPFADPLARSNPARVADCGAVEPRRTSWFVAAAVQTVRVALLRFGHAPDHTPLPKLADDDLKAAFALEMARLSDQYRRLGVRFVFDPDHDFRRVDDPVADDPNNGRGLALAISRIAAGELYGKITVALTERGVPGGTTAWNVEYEPQRIVDPVSGEKFDFARWAQDPASVYDRAGLPALSNFIDFGAAAVSLDTRSSLRQAQEFGHYFGLVATNGRPAPADAPEDAGAWRAWIEAGAPPCGNLRSLAVNGKTFAPDRTNGESPWGCEIGRSLGALTPMQLARASWTLRYQLNRLPLTACGPAVPYNADIVNCEDPQSLALCRETSAYLRKTTGVESIACRGGGAIQRAIGGAMKWAGVAFIFKSTPQGQALINALAGRGRSASPILDKVYDDVAAALAAGENPPLARALLNRIGEIRDMATRDHNALVDEGFTAKPDKPFAPADVEALQRYAAATLTPDFIANVPAIVK